MMPTNDGRLMRPIQRISALKWAQVALVQCEGYCELVRRAAYGQSQTSADRKPLPEVVEII